MLVLLPQPPYQLPAALSLSLHCQRKSREICSGRSRNAGMQTSSIAAEHLEPLVTCALSPLS